MEKYWLRLSDKEIENPYARIDTAEDTIFIPWSLHNCEVSQGLLINGTAWPEEARLSVRLMAMDERIWTNFRGPEDFVYFAGLEKFTLVAQQTLDLESPPEKIWGEFDANIAFVAVDDEEIVSE
jgi:hypothetical protein